MRYSSRRPLTVLLLVAIVAVALLILLATPDYDFVTGWRGENSADSRPDAHLKVLPEAVSESVSPAPSVADPVNDLDSDHSTSDPVQYASVWGTIQTEYGAVTSHDRIIFFSISLNKAYTTFSNSNGYFYIDQIIPADDYGFWVLPVGMFRRHVEKPVILLSDERAFSIVLKEIPVAAFKGKVVTTAGIGVSGFGLRVRSSEKSQWLAEIITDSAGRFQVDNVPIGELEFSSTFGNDMLITGHEFSGDRQGTFTLLVDRGPFELRGVVHNQYNQPLNGANVVLGWENRQGQVHSVINRYVVTDASGRFSMQQIGAGEHRLMITDNTGSSYFQSVDIGDAVADLDITLTRTETFN